MVPVNNLQQNLGLQPRDPPPIRSETASTNHLEATMPTLILKTNAPRPEDTDGLLLDASAAVAEALGKPERYVMVLLEPTIAMCFAADTEPCAYLELKSIGLAPEATQALSATLCAFVEDRLGVPRERVYIEFADLAREMFGWNGSTFARG
jgi:phenylpyruvate tautomerase